MKKEKIEMMKKAGRNIMKPYVGVDTHNRDTVTRFLEIAASASCVLEINYEGGDETWCYVIDTTKGESIVTFVWRGEIDNLFYKVVYPTISWRYSEWS